MTSAPPAASRVLFVCSGNICRSPLAEAIFKSLAREAGLDGRFIIDSAGTHRSAGSKIAVPGVIAASEPADEDPAFSVPCG